MLFNSFRIYTAKCKFDGKAPELSTRMRNSQQSSLFFTWLAVFVYFNQSTLLFLSFYFWDLLKKARKQVNCIIYLFERKTKCSKKTVQFLRVFFRGGGRWNLILKDLSLLYVNSRSGRGSDYVLSSIRMWFWTDSPSVYLNLFWATMLSDSVLILFAINSFICDWLIRSVILVTKSFVTVFDKFRFLVLTTQE